MLKIEILSMTPSQAFRFALEVARDTSHEIHDLETSGLRSGETMDERVRAIALLAKTLADAFVVIDAIASRVDAPLMHDDDNADNAQHASDDAN